MSAPAICFVLYSEDSGEALETLRHLLAGMLRLICPSVKMNHVEVEPALPSEDRVPGNLWKTWEKSREKSRDAQRKRRLLIGAVARALALGKIVFFHVDADAVWAARWRGNENLREHWPRFCPDVLAVLGAQQAPKGPRDLTELEKVLILTMPSYEMEGWAFANTGHLHKILTVSSDLAELARWENDLAQLDEIKDIKDLLTINGTRNAELVQAKHGFPLTVLAELRKSYFATIARLRASETVLRGLEDTVGRDF